MTEPQSSSGGTQEWVRRDGILNAFEEAWQQGERPAIERFLPAGEGNHLPLLFELVSADLEYRLRAGEHARVEDYLARFRELAADPPRLCELIAWEFTLLRGWQPGVTAEEYCRRFSREAAVLAPLLEKAARGKGLARPAPAGEQSTIRPGAAAPQDTGTQVRSGDPQDVLSYLLPPQGPDEIGRLGPFRILKVLGAGAMGVVFQGQDVNLKRLVAIKMMRKELAADATARERFLREAQVAAAVRHDHVVTIYRVDEDGGTPYLAMEFLQGETLEARLQRVRCLPIAEVLRIGREIAEGLSAAHEQAGLVHRDIKPANLWLEARPSPLSPRGRGDGGEGGRVKILDFGLARPVLAEGHLTQTNAIVGTAHYMSPEQVRAKKDLSHHSDLFGLGCVLYRLATGKLPFEGPDTFTVLMAVVEVHPPAPREVNPGVPAALSDLIVRLLSKELADRPASAREVVEAIRDIEAALLAVPAEVAPSTIAPPPCKPISPPDSEPTAVVVPPKPSAEVHKPGRRRWALGAAAAGVVLLLALAAWGVYQFKTNYGTLIITTDDPNAEVEVKGNDIVILSGKDRYELKLRPGTIEVDLRGGGGDLQVSNNRIVLSRGGKVTVKIERIPPSPPPGVIPPWMPKEVVAVPWPSHWRYSPHPDGCPFACPSLSFAADGKTVIAVTPHVGGVRVWQPADGKDRALFPEKGATGFAVSPDGLRVAMLFVNGNDWYWRVCQVGGPPEGTRGPFGTGTPQDRLAFSPTGGRLATAGPDGSVTVWEGSEKRDEFKVEVSRLSRPALAFSSDGNLLAVAGGKGDREVSALAVRVRDVAARLDRPLLLEAKVVPPTAGPVQVRVAFSADGGTLACGNPEQLHLWDVATGKPGPKIAWNGPPPGSFVSFSFGPAGKTLVCSTDKGTVRLVDAETAKEQQALRAPSEAPVVAVALSPDGRLLAGAGRNGHIWVWDVAKGDVLHRPDGPGDFLALASDGKTVALASDGKLTIRDWTNPQDRGRDVFMGKAAEVSDAVFAPDGKTLATLRKENNTHRVDVWDVVTGEPYAVARDFNSSDTFLAFSPDGTTLAVAGSQLVGGNRNEPWVRFWSTTDVKNGKGPSFEKKWPEPVGSLAFAPDGRTLAIGVGTRIVLWDIAAKTERPPLNEAGPYPKLVFSADGKRLASLGQNGRAVLWDVAAGKELFHRKQEGNNAYGLGLALTPDGKTLITSGPDGRIIRSMSAEERQEWWFPATVPHLALTPDGKRLLARLGDGTTVVLRLGP